MGEFKLEAEKEIAVLSESAKGETKDLIIKPSTFEEISQFFMWETWPEVTEFFSIGDGQDIEMVTEKFVEDRKNPKASQFTIYLKAGSDGNMGESQIPIGRIIFADIEQGWKAELWRIYIADKSLRGKGYGKQAMIWAMDYCFRQLQLERLYLDHYTGNPAAGLYQKLGFQYEGVLRKNCRKNGVLYDVHLMSMLREEYENGKR